MPFEVTKAKAEDAAAISELLNHYAQKRIVLPRTPQDILDYLPNFMVARNSEDGTLVGSVALRDFGDGLNEIRSLAVREECHNHGVGGKLVEAALELARQRGVSRVFALTLRPDFFAAHGFSQVSMDNFPQKVWADCRLCPKRDKCDEIAMQFLL